MDAKTKAFLLMPSSVWAASLGLTLEHVRFRHTLKVLWPLVTDAHPILRLAASIFLASKPTLSGNRDEDEEKKARGTMPFVHLAISACKSHPDRAYPARLMLLERSCECVRSENLDGPLREHLQMADAVCTAIREDPWGELETLPSAGFQDKAQWARLWLLGMAVRLSKSPLNLEERPDTRDRLSVLFETAPREAWPSIIWALFCSPSFKPENGHPSHKVLLPVPVWHCALGLSLEDLDLNELLWHVPPGGHALLTLAAMYHLARVGDHAVNPNLEDPYRIYLRLLDMACDESAATAIPARMMLLDGRCCRLSIAASIAPRVDALLADTTAIWERIMSAPMEVVEDLSRATLRRSGFMIAAEEKAALSANLARLWLFGYAARAKELPRNFGPTLARACKGLLETCDEDIRASVSWTLDSVHAFSADPPSTMEEH